MAIDLSKERILTFPELAGHMPRRRRGRPVHVSTIHRWRGTGVRGIRLDAVRIGGAWHTSWEAFARFCEALTALESGTEQPAATSSTTAFGHPTADASLETEGW